MSMTHDRYQIGCSYCGHVASNGTKRGALEDARYEQSRHNGPDEQITVYDLMAHRARPQEWKPDGFILRWRPLRP